MYLWEPSCLFMFWRQGMQRYVLEYDHACVCFYAWVLWSILTHPTLTIPLSSYLPSCLSSCFLLYSSFWLSSDSTLSHSFLLTLISTPTVIINLSTSFTTHSWGKKWHWRNWTLTHLLGRRISWMQKKTMMMISLRQNRKYRIRIQYYGFKCVVECCFVDMSSRSRKRNASHHVEVQFLLHFTLLHFTLLHLLCFTSLYCSFSYLSFKTTLLYSLLSLLSLSHQ